MGWLFEFLFKYPRVVYEQGDFTFAVSRSTMLTLAVVAAVAAAALITYRGITRDEGSARDRLVLISIRVGVIALLLFCLFRPSLVLRAAVPQQNFLGVLIDDSRSMTIADTDGKARTDFVQAEFGNPDSPLVKALSDKFVLRYFKFSASADRLAKPADLKYAGTSTRVGQALDRARDELAGLPLAGLVMVTDGADTSDAALDDQLTGLKARGIPVFTVGVGQSRFLQDIQVTRIGAPRSTLKGTTLTVDVVLSHTGYSGRTVPLVVEDNGRIVTTEDVRLPADGESATVRVNFTASEAGSRLFRFRVAMQDGEQVEQNNQRDVLVQVLDRTEKVLYMEGEPRFEVKFIRRAVEDDKNLQLVVLLRTAEDKYWRGAINSEDELAAGFPKTREELFAYRAVILGSVEAAAFTPDQLRMLADFVSKRGGGLIMLGGRRAFVEGGWAGTPVAEVLPVELKGGATQDPSRLEATHLQVRPTRAGAAFPLTQLTADEEGSAARWNELPTVTSVNALPLNTAKRGATVLLTGADDNRREQIVLAYQRYGRGKSLVFPVQDSWNWQMDATIAVEDMTHEVFWRRLVRWLVDGVPENVGISTAVDRVEPGEPMRLTAEVVDAAFEEVNDAHVTAEVKSPSGKVTQVPMEWTVERAGEYKASFVPDEEGFYEVRASAARPDKDLGTTVISARASAGDSEYFDAAMRESLLTRIAEDTGGRFYAASDVSSLPEAINYSGRGVTVVEERELWDMPAILMVLLALIAAEWGYRRKRGLA